MLIIRRTNADGETTITAATEWRCPHCTELHKAELAFTTRETGQAGIEAGERTETLLTQGSQELERLLQEDDVLELAEYVEQLTEAVRVPFGLTHADWMQAFKAISAVLNERRA